MVLEIDHSQRLLSQELLQQANRKEKDMPKLRRTTAADHARMTTSTTEARELTSVELGAVAGARSELEKFDLLPHPSPAPRLPPALRYAIW